MRVAKADTSRIDGARNLVNVTNRILELFGRRLLMMANAGNVPLLTRHPTRRTDENYDRVQ